jgi:hypothetical protein
MATVVKNYHIPAGFEKPAKSFDIPLPLSTQGLTMYTLFNGEAQGSRANFSFPAFDYARDALLRDTDRWVEYRRERVASVESNHLLAKIINALNISFDGNLDRYRLEVERHMQRIVGSFNLTSGNYRGRPFSPGVFYGEEATEIILATDEDFSLSEADQDWKYWSPVRVISHYRSDLGLESLDGKSKSEETGLAVIALNIPMLACQYQMWKAQVKADSAGSTPTVAQFLMAYPLTNALYSHLDVAIFNRVCRRFQGRSCGDSHRSYPLFRSDLTGRFDNVIGTMLDRFTKTDLSFTEILLNLRGIKRFNQLEVQRLPDMQYSFQAKWGLIGARLNVIAFLVQFRAETDGQRSLMEMQRIKRSLMEIASNRSLSNGLPDYMADYFKIFIDTQIKPFL